MRLVVLSYRLTKIKGVLVSVGICALTNATMFIASVAGAAGIALSLSSAAQAQTTPGCNASNGDGTITSSTTATQWTSPAICTVGYFGSTIGSTIATSNADALTASGPNLANGSLINYGVLHASLTGTVLTGAYIGALSNVTNVGSIKNNGDSSIIGDYQGGTIVKAVAQPFDLNGSISTNTFRIDGVNNQSAGTIQSFSNYGLIQATINSGMGPNTVQQGILVGLNNDGSIGTLLNSSLISASLGASFITITGNNFTVVALANSNQIGTLTNTGTIEGDEVGILNGNVNALSGPSAFAPTSATISNVTNSGLISGSQAGILNTGHISTITNSGVITGGTAAILSGPSSSIGAINNTGTISAGSAAMKIQGTLGSLTNSGIIAAGVAISASPTSSIGSIDNQALGQITGNSYAAMVLAGTLGTLTNEGFIGTGGEGHLAIVNGGTINTLINSGEIIAAGTAIVNQGGTINSLTNSGTITGGNIGVANVFGTLVSTIGSYGTINSFVNSGTISGNLYGIENLGSIGSLTNSGVINGGDDGILNSGSISGSIGTLSNTGTISGASYGLYNEGGSIGTLTNAGTIKGGSTGVYNTGLIASLTNSGVISGPGDYGIYNDSEKGGTGTINALVNASGGTISGASTGIANAGLIGQLTNSGVISGTEFAGISNNGSGTITSLVNLSGGTINGGGSGVYNDKVALIGSLTNNGLIVGGESGVENQGSIGTLSNTGLITGGIYGVYNEGGVIDSLYNNGTISGTTVSGTVTTYGIYTTNLITSLTNDTLGTISGATAIYNDGNIGTLTNSGAILGQYTGVRNYGTLSELNNSGKTAVIVGAVAVLNQSDGSIGSLVNSGTISGGETGLENYGTIASLVNSGQITGADDGVGIYNTGLVTSLSNQGLISGPTTGLYNDEGGSIGTLSNSGTISGAKNAGVFNQGTITSLGNTGHISGTSAGISNHRGSIDVLTNSGTIEATGTIGDGVYNSGSIVSFTNGGLIQGTRSGIYNVTAVEEPGVLQNAQPLAEIVQPAVIVTLINSSSGTITGTETGLYNASLIGGVVNSGLISGGGIGLNNDTSGSIIALLNTGTVTGGNFGLVNAGSLESLVNSGTIKDDSKAGIENSGSIGTLTSSGLISGAVGLSNTGGSIGSLDNSGTITGTLSDGVYSAGAIGPMSNEGVIRGAVNALNIDASGSIGPLTNSGLISAPTAITVAEGGSLGAIANTGTIAGNILNASGNELSIAGASTGGPVYGTVTGYTGGISANGIGQITSTAANVAFTGGNILLNDHINVGTGTVTSAATLQVNNPLNITGTYVQTDPGTLSVGVASVSNHGELNVSSAATVNPGGHVALTQLDNFRFAAGESFTLIDASSATYNVAGMTAKAAGFNGGYLVSDVLADGHSDLVVCLTNIVKSNCNGAPAYSVATTSNAVIANNAVGSYMGSNVALNKLADAVTALGTSPAANRAGNQLLADPHNNATGLAMQPSLDVLNVVTGHADTTRLAANGTESGVSAGESGTGFATWGEAFGGGAHQSGDGQFSGYAMSSEGLVAGGDVRIADSNTRVGAVFSYTHADLHDHGDRTGDTMSLDSYGVIAYGSYLGAHAYVDVLGGVLSDKFDTVRVIDFTGFNGVASGTHDGTQYVAKLAGGYRLPMGASSGTTLTPVWGVIYSHLNQDGYTETGGNGAALNVASEGDNSLKGEAGLKLERSFKMASGDFVPEVKVMYRHEFDNGAQLQTASYAADASESTFSTLNVRPIENSELLSAGVNLLGKDGVTVTLKYTAEAASGYLSQGGSLRVRWAF